MVMGSNAGRSRASIRPVPCHASPDSGDALSREPVRSAWERLECVYCPRRNHETHRHKSLGAKRLNANYGTHQEELTSTTQVFGCTLVNLRCHSLKWIS